MTSLSTQTGTPYDGRSDGTARGELDGARQAYADAPQRRAGVLAVAEQPVEEPLKLSQAGFRSCGNVHGLFALEAGPAGQVGQRDADAGRAKLRREDAASASPDADLARGPAARGRRRVAILGHPEVDQLADALRDHRPAKASPPHELWPGDVAVSPDQVDD